MADRGRRSKLTPEVQERIVAAIASGQTYDVACELAGISKGTYHNWKSLGRKEKQGKLREFLDAVTRAEAEAEKHLIEVIRTAAEKGDETVEVVTVRDASGQVISTRTTQRTSPRDWRAAAKMLEMRNPEQYGRRITKHEGIPESTAPPSVVLVFDDGEGDPDGPAKRLSSDMLFDDDEGDDE